LRAWVLSPAGRLIAAPKETSPAAGPAGGTGLPADVCARLAAEHLAAGRSGRRGPHRVTLGATTYSLFPVRSTGRAPESGRGGKDAPAPAEGALADWVLAVEADAGDWAEERLDLLHGVIQLIAVERDRRDAARTVRRRLAQEVLELVQTGAAPAAIAARLRVAAPALLPGLGPAAHWPVVGGRGGRGGGGRGGGPSAAGAAARSRAGPGATPPAGAAPTGGADARGAGGPSGAGSGVASGAGSGLASSRAAVARLSANRVSSRVTA